MDYYTTSYKHGLLSSYMQMFHHILIDRVTQLLQIPKSSAIDHD